ANTNGGVFSTRISFSTGLNVIRAENSSGKSTCVNAIAYGLGLEAILGPARKRPFPKSLYEQIYDNKVDKNVYFVSNSFVCISIRNNKNQTAILTRDILGNDKKVKVKINEVETDYFLGVSGEVGSAKSERGFHNWLAGFIGWVLPNVVTFEGKERILYLECIFPLFFIEQKRGWSEIQANIPTQYGIQNVKKSASEFCLGIDSFEHNKKIHQLKSIIDKAKDEWDALRASSESIADFSNVRVNRLVEIDKDDSIPLIEFAYLENDIYINVFNQEKALKKLIEKLSSEISDPTIDNEKITTQLSIIGVLRREFEETSNSVESMLFSSSEIDSKLKILRHDFDQYQQLRRLKSVGSDISADLETKKCPICESDLYDTLSSSSVKRQPMTLEENIEFLKNQIDFFSSIKKRSSIELQDLQSRSKLLRAKIESEQEKLSELRADLNDVNGEEKSKIREKLEAEMQLKNVIKLKEIQKNLNEKSEKIFSSWRTASESLKLVRKGAFIEDKSLVIRKLEGLLKANLTSFGFDPTSINSISISPQTLRPEQEGYDIVAESSASDYIRIIWSYTLALLELAGTESDIKHGGFVIFDEPRQHEASKISFSSLIRKASQSKLFGGQVIFATSLDKDQLCKACEGLHVNVYYYDDYILALNNEP
ncbi:MAG: hypothetical protein Q8M35_07260, partial [Pseudohongiella sp.]|nr:hypothetical protein [Pseudohongiella sp.]